MSSAITLTFGIVFSFYPCFYQVLYVYAPVHLPIGKDGSGNCYSPHEYV